jgi:hypothetical protein
MAGEVIAQASVFGIAFGGSPNCGGVEPPLRNYGSQRLRLFHPQLRKAARTLGASGRKSSTGTYDVLWFDFKEKNLYVIW